MLDPESPSSEASTSTPPRSFCSVCAHKYAIYTCPGCHTRTCSLPCSSVHKSNTSCLGTRNKAAYVPMNQYGWGTMMDDYTFLEDVGRHVSNWGREIARGRLGHGETRDRGQGRGRGRGASMTMGPPKTKREILKVQLEARDIDMDLLPMGMERRKLNQSSWDVKNQTPLLTIEFKFHCPPNPLAPASQDPEPPFILLTHRNKMSAELLPLIQTHIKDRTASRKEGACPAWVQALVVPDPDDPDAFAPPQCVIPATVDPLSARVKRAYYKLEPSQTLGVLLQNTHFVEYPTIEVWEEFKGTLIDVQGSITQTEEPRVKRRRLDLGAGKKAINGLLGGYGSDEDEQLEKQNVLTILDDYAESDEEGEVQESAAVPLYLGEDEDAEGVTDDEIELDAATLFELVHQAGGVAWESVTGDDDTVDWGDSGGEGVA